MPRFQVRPMSRTLYLGTLALLQLALFAHVAPPLARTFKAHALFASLHDGWAVAAQLAAVALAVAGAAIALAFPLLALSRHAKRGRLRFLGLPRWAIRVGIAGGALFALALVATALATLLPALREALAPLGQSAAIGGTALMAAGALCAELLRRSIPPVPSVDAPWRCAPVRIAAIDRSESAERVA
jgi:hypothetical protein